MRQSELCGRLVLDLETTEEVGRVSQFRVDPNTQQVEGFVCKSGVLGLENVPISWVQVESVGKDSILVRRRGSVATARFDEAFPLDKLALWSDSGNSIGQIVDYFLNLQTGAITQYLFTAPGFKALTDGVYTFQPDAVVSIGRKRMMARQAELENAPQFVPGVPDRVTEAWQRDLTQTRQDLKGAVEGTREIAGQVQQQTQKFTEQARSQLGQVFGQVKQRSQQLRSEVNDRIADAAANLQSTSESTPSTPPPELEEIWPEDSEES
jgi:uncharacterized protein YrrD